MAFNRSEPDIHALSLSRMNLYILLTLTALFVGFIYYPVFVWLVEKWYNVSRYSHGFLVVGIIAWLVKQELPRLERTPPLPSRGIGMAIVIIALVLQALTLLLDIKTLSAYSLMLLAGGLILALAGGGWLRILSFPLLYFAFVVPPPSFLIDSLSNTLRLMAAGLAERLLDLLGVIVVREGVMLHLSNASLEVADPCSGIQSLFALLALSALYAHFWQGALWKKSILFLSALPIAVISNVVRIALLCAATLTVGQKAAIEGPFHMVSGLMVFVIAFLGLFLLGRLLQWRHAEKRG